MIFVRMFNAHTFQTDTTKRQIECDKMITTNECISIYLFCSWLYANGTLPFLVSFTEFRSSVCSTNIKTNTAMSHSVVGERKQVELNALISLSVVWCDVRLMTMHQHIDAIVRSCHNHKMSKMSSTVMHSTYVCRSRHALFLIIATETYSTHRFTR